MILMPGIAWALDGKINGESVSEHKLMADTAWTMITAMLVFWMQAGFAMVESGYCRAKNSVNLMMKNLLDFCISSLAFWAVGFAFMFGAGNDFLGWTGFFAKADTGDLYPALAWTSVPTLCAWFFQLVFAGTAATIVSGAVAERITFRAYLIYSLIISGVVYPVIGHWIWGGGWLAKLGMVDFAGSTVVHSVGGWFGLCGAIMLGPRIGKYGRDGKVHPIPGHSMPLASLGTFILWLGWFGFNPGSTMGLDWDGISNTAVTTNLAAAMGAVAALITSWLKFGKPDIGMALNGTLGGLVAITAGCYFVSPAGSICIGLTAGIVVVHAVVALDSLRIDDPVGAVSVHAVCGVLGTVLTGVFHVKQGVAYHFQDVAAWRFMGVQLLGSISVFLVCVAGGFALFAAIKALFGLRVSEAEEIDGLDVHEHGAKAYPDFVLAGAPVTAQAAMPQPSRPVVGPSAVAATAASNPGAGSAPSRFKYPPPKPPASLIHAPPFARRDGPIAGGPTVGTAARSSGRPSSEGTAGSGQAPRQELPDPSKAGPPQVGPTKSRRLT
ncbi:MAG: ammonium transporter [Nitrospirae bacterium]|nr:ammonium transporter [Nitrospirota bacterium]